VWIVESVDDRSHKANCEKAFTLAYQHYNCVLTLNVAGKDNQSRPPENYVPIMLSNLDANMLDNFGEGELEFTQNTVPFDFDGQRLLWMHYVTKDEREVFIYDFEEKKKTKVMEFKRRDGLVSHMKMIGNQVFFVRNTKEVMKHDIVKNTQSLVGTTRDSILAMHVTQNVLREFD
jgi:hypothetical protein